MDKKQLTFGFPHTPSYGPQDFALFSSNQDAYRWIESFPNWNVPGLVLVGPTGSGKTHLTHVLQEKSGGQIIQFADLSESLLETLESLPKVIIIENCNTWDRTREVILFHLYNHLIKHQGLLVLTSVHPVNHWSLKLPDFQSRVKTLAEVTIGEPEDELLLAILIKRFADHQIKVDFKIAEFLIKRLPRTYGEFHQVIDLILEKNLEQKKGITIPFLKNVLPGLKEESL